MNEGDGMFLLLMGLGLITVMLALVVSFDIFKTKPTNNRFINRREAKLAAQKADQESASDD